MFEFRLQAKKWKIADEKWKIFNLEKRINELKKELDLKTQAWKHLKIILK